MSTKRKKISNNTRRKNQKAAVRKLMVKKAKRDVRRYLSMRSVKSSKQADTDDFHKIISFPNCAGVGECCKNRPLFLEPTDVYRIMHNEMSRKKFGFEVTMDLYSRGEETGPLHYGVDSKVFLPFCAVVRVPVKSVLSEDGRELGIAIEPDDQICPFLIFNQEGVPECILGEDRPTQCFTDPVIRVNRVKGYRKIKAWEYAVVKHICDGCRQASDDNVFESVSSWLAKKRVEGRYIESDMFHGFIEWMEDRLRGVDDIGEKLDGKSNREFLWKMATTMLFDWHRFAIDFLQQPKDEVIAHGPDTPRRVIESAQKLMEGIISTVGKQEERVNGSTNKG